jgi:hypothetical protein
MSDQITSDHPMPSTKSKTTNILTLDGGGVRGLSSLIILKCLMKHVNEQEGLPPEGLTPKDIFSLVAGTSTGGLIAIMLGRFGMSVDDCIVQYWTFSKEIFGHYSILGKWSWGILKERYDGGRLRNSVRQLAARKDICDNQSVMMQGPGHKNGIPWYSDLPSACSSLFQANTLQHSAGSRIRRRQHQRRGGLSMQSRLRSRISMSSVRCCTGNNGRSKLLSFVSSRQ